MIVGEQELAAVEHLAYVRALQEAIRICESQVIPEELTKDDEYRRGQRRGSHDCVSVLERHLRFHLDQS